MMHGWTRTTGTVVVCAAIALAAHGCSDRGGSDESAAGGASSGGGGAGAAAGGGGGAGGGGAGCLPAPAFEELFTLEETALCVVALYDADVSLGFSLTPTWGRHGGPLTLAPGAAAGSVDLVRWSPPASATGAMTASVTSVLDAQIPVSAFLGAQAVDLPFFSWTAVSYTDGGFPFTGELLLARADGTIDRRYAANGVFSVAGLAAPGGQGRIVYSGLSVLDDVAGSTNGLFAADSCGSVGNGERLAPEGDAGCTGPTALAAWGDFSGPIAADGDGNLVAVLPSAAGTQEARGFAASVVARGGGATAGDPLFSLPGTGTALALITPAGGQSGWIAFQPSDPQTWEPLDVIAARYDASAGTLALASPPAPLLGLATPGTQLALFVDDESRLWVGSPTADGTRFAVIVRAP